MEPRLSSIEVRENLTDSNHESSNWYQRFFSGFITTVNGKLVSLNLRKSQEIKDQFNKTYPHLAPEDNTEEYLQLFVETLERRLKILETKTIERLNKKVENLEKKTSQRMLAISIATAIGFTSLGLVIGLNHHYAMANQASRVTPEAIKTEK